MDARTFIDVACVAFGCGSFIMGALVAKLMLAEMRTDLEKRFAAERDWIRDHFVPRPTSEILTSK